MYKSMCAGRERERKISKEKEESVKAMSKQVMFVLIRSTTCLTAHT